MSSLPYCSDLGSSMPWESRRRPTRHSDQTLIVEAEQWLATLPDDAQSHALAARFPRIVNNIVARLSCPRELADYMDDLLVDRRGNRTGFPVAVMTDLIRLNSHFLKTGRYPSMEPTIDRRPTGAIPSRERSVAPETLRRERSDSTPAQRPLARRFLLRWLRDALRV
jgi:hypothetical protein